MFPIVLSGCAPVFVGDATAYPDREYDDGYVRQDAGPASKDTLAGVAPRLRFDDEDHYDLQAVIPRKCPTPAGSERGP